MENIVIANGNDVKKQHNHETQEAFWNQRQFSGWQNFSYDTQ